MSTDEEIEIGKVVKSAEAPDNELGDNWENCYCDSTVEGSSRPPPPRRHYDTTDSNDNSDSFDTEIDTEDDKNIQSSVLHCLVYNKAKKHVRKSNSKRNDDEDSNDQPSTTKRRCFRDIESMDFTENVENYDPEPSGSDTIKSLLTSSTNNNEDDTNASVDQTNRTVKSNEHNKITKVEDKAEKLGCVSKAKVYTNNECTKLESDSDDECCLVILDADTIVSGDSPMSIVIASESRPDSNLFEKDPTNMSHYNSQFLTEYKSQSQLGLQDDSVSETRILTTHEEYLKPDSSRPSRGELPIYISDDSNSLNSNGAEDRGDTKNRDVGRTSEPGPYPGLSNYTLNITEQGLDLTVRSLHRGQGKAGEGSKQMLTPIKPEPEEQPKLIVNMGANRIPMLEKKKAVVAPIQTGLYNRRSETTTYENLASARERSIINDLFAAERTLVKSPEPPSIYPHSSTPRHNMTSTAEQSFVSHQFNQNETSTTLLLSPTIPSMAQQISPISPLSPRLYNPLTLPLMPQERKCTTYCEMDRDQHRFDLVTPQHNRAIRQKNNELNEFESYACGYSHARNVQTPPASHIIGSSTRQTLDSQRYMLEAQRMCEVSIQATVDSPMRPFLISPRQAIPFSNPLFSPLPTTPVPLRGPIYQNPFSPPPDYLPPAFNFQNSPNIQVFLEEEEEEEENNEVEVVNVFPNLFANLNGQREMLIRQGENGYRFRSQNVLPNPPASVRFPNQGNVFSPPRTDRGRHYRGGNYDNNGGAYRH